MRLKELLSNKRISQVEIWTTARKLGHRLEQSRTCLVVNGRLDSAPAIVAVRDALLELGVSAKELRAIEELKGAKL
jgi:hypothetical protein